MNFKYTENTRSINEIRGMFQNGELTTDDSYQRRSIWLEKDQIRLIETILLNFVVPSVYFWQSDTNPETGAALIHIVDGQQRLKAIMNFIDNKFPLKENALMEEKIIQSYKGKYFYDLSDYDKKMIWNYKLSVIQIDLNAKREDIIKMFTRLNLTEYVLNNQEKRNATRGLFHELALEISESEFWEEINFFNLQDSKRMRDIEFSANIILLCKYGIIEQSNSSLAINKAYDEFKENYPERDEHKLKIFQAQDMIKRLYSSGVTRRFVQKKTQMYTLFSICFYLIRKDIEIDDQMKKRFDAFVNVYSKYKNDETSNLQFDNEESKFYDLFKKYKQASSEGVNKLSNRVARFDVLKKILLDDIYDQETMDSIYKKLSEG